MKKPALLAITILLLSSAVFSQDTLPRFSVINAGNNRIIIGWVNKLEDVKQISIQRSFDSLTGFKSILTVPDPTTLQNGYLDSKATNDHMFYRLYIMQDKGRFMFSAAKKPVKDSSNNTGSVTRINPVTMRPDAFPVTDSVTVPTPVSVKKGTNSFVPSLYVYTCRDGYVCIRLPEDEKPKKYTLRFFDDEFQLLFELKEVKTREFKLDKANFYHAGWFHFELYDDGKLIEKHKFYLEKDF
jgi:hypothetical protein